MRKGKQFLVILITILLLPKVVLAAPYFEVTGPLSIHKPNSYAYDIYLYPDSQAINVAQTVLNFDKNYLEADQISTLNSRCSFFSPADPLLGYGSTSTPYIYNDEKAVIACGFANLGIVADTTTPQFIAKVTLSPIVTSNISTSLEFSDSLYKYIGQPVNAGLDQSLTLQVYFSTASANPTATPYPSPTPVNPRTITSDDLTFIDISTGSTRLATSSPVQSTTAISPIPVVPLDDSIPTPGPLTGRPTLSPFKSVVASASSQGDILSLRSLRELLIPGNSTADKTVVFINLLTTLAFLVILTFLLWRMFLLSRTNKLKISHMQQLIEGEIAMLLGKTQSQDPKVKEQVEDRLEDLQENIDKTIKPNN